MKAIRDRSGFSASLGDAGVQEWRNLRHGAAVDPSVFPEQGALAVTNRRGCGRKEERAFLARELQVKAAPGPAIIDVAEPKPARAQRVRCAQGRGRQGRQGE